MTRPPETVELNVGSITTALRDFAVFVERGHTEFTARSLRSLADHVEQMADEQAELATIQRTILAHVADPAMRRDDVAVVYALGLRSMDEVDWTAVNAAIITRWSESGLEYVKREAWRRV